MATSTTENERIARRVPEEIATEHRLDLIDEVYAGNAVERDPFGEYRGREEIRAGIERIHAAFPDITATVEDAVAEGDTVAMRITLRGTHEGPFEGVEATGRGFEIANQVFTRIEDGKITERWVQPDALGLMVQLGIVEPPTE